MLLHLLLHVLIFHLLTAKGGEKDAGKANIQQLLRDQASNTAKTNEKQHSITPKDTNYVIKHIDECPLRGYYFARDHSPNKVEPDICYLCFCQAEKTAVCWKRDNKRCNDESFRYQSIGNRGDIKTSQSKSNDTRIRRSPGLADIFFRDASRDVLNKNTPDQQCKPYESSFSDDCPPADWCTGCTVCDCDSNGRWDCHILSFCSDRVSGYIKYKMDFPGPSGEHDLQIIKSKKRKPVVLQEEERKERKKEKRAKKKSDERKLVKKKRVAGLPPAVRPRKSKPILGWGDTDKKKKHKSGHKKRVVQKSVTRPRSPQRKQEKKKPPLRYKRIASKPKNSKAMFKKKNVGTHKPVHFNKNKSKNKNQKVRTKNDVSNDMAKKIVKQMMSVVNKLVTKQLRNMTKIVAKLQQRNNKQTYYTSVTPRIIGGTRKWRQKRDIQEENNEQTEQISRLERIKSEDNKEITSTEANIQNATESATSLTTQEDVQNKSTILSVTPDNIRSDSISPKSNFLGILPISTNSDRENDYYKYIIATHTPSPLTQIQTTEDNVSKSIVISEVIVNDLTGMTIQDKIETTEIPKTETVNINIITQSSENIGLDNKKSLELSTENYSTLSKSLNNISREKIRTNGTVSDIVLNNQSYPYEVMPKVNLTRYKTKLSDWPQRKIARHKIIKPVIKNPQDIAKFMINKTIFTKNGLYKVRRKDVNRIMGSKKYNVFKTLKYQRCPFLNKEAVNENGTYIITPGKRVPDVNNPLTKLLNQYYNTKKPRRKFKNFSVIKYLRKLFNNMFKRKNKMDRFSRYHILETLCEHFGPCSIQQKDRHILRSKLIDLDHETLSILKTVKIIKGLLKLLNDGANNSELSKQVRLNNDIQKLNSIMKGTYGDNSKEPLTQTKLTQIEYVKHNIQEFVKSVGKFATLLDEIIVIITKHDKKSNQKLVSMYTTAKDPFQNLRDLLVKYNLVQNTFMRKMYDLVNSFEDKFYEKPKSSTADKLNSSIAIENFSRTILKNLRKLKYLAQTLNNNGRTKRETRDDDAIQYLLMVMEYLLKQNHPLDVAPANDGIDLLLEAIKNAPDIKTVRKKVLVNTPSGFDTTVTSISRNILYRSTTDSSVSADESDSETISNEDSDTSKVNVSSNALKTKIEETKDFFDMVEDDIDKIHFDRRAEVIPKFIDGTTNEPLYDDFDNNTLGNSLGVLEPTISPPIYNEEDNFDNGTMYTDDDKNTAYVNPNNANNNFYENTEPINVFSNTVNANYDTFTAYVNIYPTNTAHPNTDTTNAVEDNNNIAIDNDSDNINMINVKDSSIKTLYDSTSAVTEENKEIVTEESLKARENIVKKAETAFAEEVDEEEVKPASISGVNSEVTVTTSPEFDYDRNKQKFKAIKTLDSYDNEKLDKKSKLEWIEENFRREFSNYDEDKDKSHEEKTQTVKLSTPDPVTVAPPSRTIAARHSQNNGPVDVSLISNEVDIGGKKKKLSINTQEVMYKKQMDLLNSLDYVTEKTEFDETESKDGTGNTDDRYSETFPTYFV